MKAKKAEKSTYNQLRKRNFIQYAFIILDETLIVREDKLFGEEDNECVSGYSIVV